MTKATSRRKLASRAGIFMDGTRANGSSNPERMALRSRVMRGKRPIGWLCAAFVAWAAPAHAQEAMGAEVLFNEGVTSMKTGDFAAACPKIAESQRLEPRPGTLFTLAECHFHEGRVATALARYDEYLREFERMGEDERRRQRGRDAVARRRKDELGPRVPKLKLILPSGAPEGTRIRKGTVWLTQASIGVELPMDPGKHQFVVVTPDGSERAFELELREGKPAELVLELPRATPRPKADSKKSAPAQVSHQRKRASMPRHAAKDRTLAYAAFGVGAAGLAVGITAGVLVFSKRATIEDNCGIGGDEHACNSAGKDAADSAQRFALISNLGFAVGAVGVGAGTVLFLSASDSGAERDAHVGVSGRW